MKSSNIYLAFCFAAALTVGCHSAMEQNEKSPASDMSMPVTMADSMSVMNEMDEGGYYKNSATKDNGFISSSAAVVNKDSTRKFVRTADMKFRVKEVRKATFSIEDIIADFDGFVTYTNLSSEINYKRLIPISKDSSLETLYYTVINDMQIRVPNTNLDTALKVIAKHIDYLDYRIIKADDVTLSLLANKLKRQRLNKHEIRLTDAIDNKGKKLNETSNAEENLLNKQMMSDQSKIENLKMEDEISFSTIKLNIYQRQTIRRELIENDKNIEGYKPGFVHQVKEAIKSGWSALELVIVFLFNIWPLLLLVAAGWVAYKRYSKMKK